MTIFTLLTEITKKQNTHNNGFQDKGANKSIEGSDSMLNRYLQGELYHWPNLLSFQAVVQKRIMKAEPNALPESRR